MTTLLAHIFRFICVLIGTVACLNSFILNAGGETQTADAARILAVTHASASKASRKLISVSQDGQNEVALLSGHILYGTDESTAVFLQSPANELRSDCRLLILDRKTFANIADVNLKSLGPVTMKSTFTERLAVRSKEFKVYIPSFNQSGFTVVEANWKTGVTRIVPVAVAPGAEHWEITGLYSVPGGIAIERGAFLTLFDPAGDRQLLALENSGKDRRPMGTYYIVPGFGVVESIRGEKTLRRTTYPDFTKALASPESFPSAETNIYKQRRRTVQTVAGKPCLIWGENTSSGSQQGRGISELVIYDLETKKIILRKPLGTDFLPDFLPDQSGGRIYLRESKSGKISCLDLASEKISSFSNTGPEAFENWVTTN